MISFTFKGHKISIRNDDWRKLKERFDVRNAEFDLDTGCFVINIPCALCERCRNFSNCKGCPLFETPGMNRPGCVNIFISIFRKDFLEISIDNICWFDAYNRQARRQLKAILRRMEKIEENQK